ncbi:MAG: AAA family ATPase [Elusimicrobia bacterium]|nr:AAA family ATPase [Elusimicrobiota bacterium]
MSDTRFCAFFKRVSAVLLCLVILAGAPGSIAIAAAAETNLKLSAAPGYVKVLPALPNAINARAGLGDTGIPAVPIVNEGPVREPRMVPSILEAAGVITVPETLLQRIQAEAAAQSAPNSALESAGALEKSAAPPSGGAASGPVDIKEKQDQVYAGAANSGVASPAAAVSGNYLESAPALPLPRLKPGWQESAAPSAPDLKYRFDGTGLKDIGDESALSVNETIKPETAANTFKDITPDNEALSYGKRLYMEVKNGLKEARMVGGRVAWTDAEGKLNLYNPYKDETTVIAAPMGAIEKFVSSPHSDKLYVVAGGHLQKWDLDTNKAVVLLDDKVTSLGIHDFSALRSSEDGIEVKTDKGHLFWTKGKVALFEGGPEEVYADKGVVPTLRQSGEFYIEKTGQGSRVWRNTLGGSGAAVTDLGTLPFDVKTVQATQGRDTLFAVTDQGVIEWDVAGRRFRLFEIEGLKKAILGRNVTLDLSLNGRHALVAAGEKIFSIDFGDSTRDAESNESKVRSWSEENPMTIKDGVLSIGDFSFPVQTRKPEAAAQRTAWQKFWDLVLRRKPQAQEQKQGLALSEEDWKAVNLPTNKWAIYQTLKGFTLGQHVLYIGETGGGKTWMADKLSKLIGRKLYMVSFTEYTKNQDLLFARTFGEEGKNKTGKTFETVLQWLSDAEGGILLLDEMHKPLEGIAALNNILQNLKYHMNGRDISGDKKTHFVVGTMNPVKPPYKGEPPSGELSSRFGVTLEVNYLPRAEEAALLKIFYPAVKQEVAKRLVDIANDLRKVYPDLLPLPVAPRTLLQIVAKLVAFPHDDPIEAFKTTYNPSSIVQDPSIIEAIQKALAAHDLAGAVNPGQKKK